MNRRKSCCDHRREQANYGHHHPDFQEEAAESVRRKTLRLLQLRSLLCVRVQAIALDGC
jgi:hypothetical protein